MSSSERRLFARIRFDSSARLIGEDGTVWETEVLDVSLRGALVARPAGWSANAGTFRLEILLNGDAAIIAMQGRIAHSNATEIGFACQDMDLDSASLLRRFVELNLGDQDLLERELRQLVSSEGV